MGEPVIIVELAHDCSLQRPILRGIIGLELGRQNILSPEASIIPE